MNDVITKLGVAIAGRNEELLCSAVAELGDSPLKQIKSSWSVVSSELTAEDIQWFRERLKERMSDEFNLEAELINPLSVDEKQEKTELEARITSYMGGYTERGEDLDVLRSKRLYRNEFSNWDLYCKHKLGLSKAYADRLIRASQTVKSLVTTGTSILPANEFVARELWKIKDIEQRAAIWEAAINKNKVVTYELIKEIKESLQHKEQVKELFYPVGELVTIKSKKSGFKNYWGRVLEHANGKYKVSVAQHLLTLSEEDVADFAGDFNVVGLVDKLMIDSNPHVREIAFTFCKYSSLESWQELLLTILKKVSYELSEQH